MRPERAGVCPIARPIGRPGTLADIRFPGSQGYRPVYEAGQDSISIYAARCHKHEMKFLAGSA